MARVEGDFLLVQNGFQHFKIRFNKIFLKIHYGIIVS